MQKPNIKWKETRIHWKSKTLFQNVCRGSSGGRVVKLLACGARGPAWVRFQASPLEFSEIGYLLLPSRNVAETLLKRHKSSIQPTNHNFAWIPSMRKLASISSAWCLYNLCVHLNIPSVPLKMDTLSNMYTANVDNINRLHYVGEVTPCPSNPVTWHLIILTVYTCSTYLMCLNNIDSNVQYQIPWWHCCHQGVLYYYSILFSLKASNVLSTS